MQSFSEQGQDGFAFEHVNKQAGTFLDVGVYDPIKNNNTYGLEKIGWTGVLFDIDPQWENPCKTHRKSPFVLGSALDIDWACLCQNFGLDSHIDYLSLDIDDTDYDPNSKTIAALNHMIDAGLSFRAITVEHDAYRLGDQPRQGIRDLLKEHGYTLAVENVSCRPPDPNWAFEDWFLGVAI